MRRSVWLSSCRKRSLLHTGAVISIYDTVKTIARKWPERHDVLSVGHYRIPGVESMLFVHSHYLGRYLCASQLGRARGDPSPEDSPSLRYRAYLVLVGVPFSVWAAAPAPAFFHPVLTRSSSGKCGQAVVALNSVDRRHPPTSWKRKLVKAGPVWLPAVLILS